MSLRATLLSIVVHLLGDRRQAVLGAGSAGRPVESCLPASARRRRTWPPRLRRWLGTAAGSASSGERFQWSGSDRSLALLLAVRREFVESLADIPTASASMLVHRIAAARSLRELWHLRPDVFDLVARYHAQGEADRRLARLNRHFPTRSPRSGFGPL